MSQVYDLSSKLVNKKPIIKIDDKHQYEVQNNKNIAILIDEISKDSKIKDYAKENDKTDKVIEATLGVEALQYLKTLDLSMAGWETIVKAIMAAINEKTIEEIDKEIKKEFRR